MIYILTLIYTTLRGVPAMHDRWAGTDVIRSRHQGSVAV